MKNISAQNCFGFMKFSFIALSLLCGTTLFGARTIIDVNFGGANNVTAVTGDTIRFNATITTDMNGDGSPAWRDDFRSIGYKIGNDDWRCADQNVGQTSSRTQTHIFNFIAAYIGVNDISFRAYSGNNCQTGGDAPPSAVFTLNKAVNITNKGWPLDYSYGLHAAEKKTILDCGYLYMAEDAVYRVNSIPEGNRPIGSGLNISEIYAAFKDTPFAQGEPGGGRDGHNTDGSRASDVNGAVFRTLAIGPYGEQNGTLTAFGWRWARSWNIGLTPSTTYGIGCSSQYCNERPAYTHNNTSIMSYMAPTPPGGDGWSGGEVNQMTGEIYFSGLEDRTFSTDYWFMMYNPLTLDYAISGRVQPASPYDALNINARVVSSDMAIDAEGNFYTLVNDGGRYQWLVKITPPGVTAAKAKANTTGEWIYNKVVRVGQFRSGDNQDVGDMTSIWGLAFFNGKLYASLFAGGSVEAALHEIDPLTGKTHYKGDFGRKPDGSIKHMIFDVKDLASCQVAIIVRGKVYLDKNGDGRIDPTTETEGLPNIVMQVYDGSGNYLGEQNTSSLGTYSFLMPSIHSNYVIRIKQPQINGSNTYQTWASGGWNDWHGVYGIHGNNTATPNCYGGINPIDTVSKPEDNPYPGQGKYYYGTTCYGVNGIDGSDTSDNSLSGANYYTNISINTDRAVTVADFALAPVDRGDAPNKDVGTGSNTFKYRFGEASHVVSSKHIFMGHNNNTDIDYEQGIVSGPHANGDDDNNKKDERAVYVYNGTTYQPIKDFIFVGNRTYEFLVKVSTEVANGTTGYLYGWINLSSNASLTAGNNITFSDKMSEGAMQDESAQDTPGKGYYHVESLRNCPATPPVGGGGKCIAFNYTIPSVVYTDNIGGERGNSTEAYVRFRYSSVKLGNKYHRDCVPGEPNCLLKWATDGEVEDYNVTYKYIKDQPVPGNFTVVNEKLPYTNNGSNKIDINTHRTFALFTQIAKKEFNAKLVYLNATASNPGIYAIPSSMGGANVSVEVIFMSGANCTGANKSVFSGNLSDTETVKLLEKINIDNITKEGSFLIKYKYVGSSIEKSSCSMDSFAVRPKEFLPTIDGINTLSGNIVGGANISIEVEARDYNNALTKQYNTSGSDITNINSSLDKPCPVGASLFNTQFNVTASNFTEGKGNITLRYDNVGRVYISVADTKWAEVDFNIPPPEKDCDIVNNTSNVHNADGKVGCYVPFANNISFVPDHFAVEVGISDFLSGFTYTSENPAMSANLALSVTAHLYNNALATNYDGNPECYAQPVSSNITLSYKDATTGNITLVGWNNPSNPASITHFYPPYPPNANISMDLDGAWTINPIAFNVGEASNVPARFTIGYINHYYNPFIVSGPTNIVSGGEVRFGGISSEGADTFSASGSATFYSGGVGPSQLSAFRGESPITATLHYEVFCDLPCNPTTFGLGNSGRDTNWYLNRNHTNITQGSILTITPNANATIVTPNGGHTSNITQGVERIEFTSTYAPLRTRVEIRPDNWLMWWPLELEFIHSGSWAGQGSVRGSNTSVGRTSSNSSMDLYENNTRKMDW